MSNYQEQFSRITPARRGAVDLTNRLPPGYKPDEHHANMQLRHVKAHPSLLQAQKVYLTTFRDGSGLGIGQPGISFTDAMRAGDHATIEQHWLKAEYVLPDAFHFVANGNLIIHWPGYKDVAVKITFCVPEQRRSCTRGEIARQVASAWKWFYDMNKDKAPAYPTNVPLGSNAIRYEDIRFLALYTMDGNNWYIVHSFVHPTIMGCHESESQVYVINRLPKQYPKAGSLVRRDLTPK